MLSVCFLIGISLLQEDKQPEKSLYAKLNVVSIANIESFHFKILLDEIGIVGDQAKKLNELVESLTKEDTELRVDLGLIDSGRKPKSLRSDIVEKLGTINSRLKEGIDKILIPHQTKRMEQALVQRTMLKLNGNAEPFEIPFLFAKDLKLSKEELRNLKKATDKAKMEFERERKKLALKAWDSIAHKLDKKQKASLKSLAGDIRQKLTEGEGN